MLLFASFMIVILLVIFVVGLRDIERATRQRLREEDELKASIESFMKSKDVLGLKVFTTINGSAIDKMDPKMNEKVSAFIDDITIEQHDEKQP